MQCALLLVLSSLLRSETAAYQGGIWDEGREGVPGSPGFSLQGANTTAQVPFFSLPVHTSYLSGASLGSSVNPHFSPRTPRTLQLSNAAVIPGCEGLNNLNSLGYGYCPACDTSSPKTNAYWKGLTWSSCSQPCGGGIMTRSVICWSLSTNLQVDSTRCNRTCLTNLNIGFCNTQPCVTKDFPEFSCDAAASNGVAKRCDGIVRDGGRLTLDILTINNADKVGDCATASGSQRCPPRYKDPPYAGLPDPYFKVTVAGRTLATPALINVKKGSWGDGANNGSALFFGLQASGTPVTLELWDRNGGLTYQDRFVTSVSTTVIACSYASIIAFGPCTENTYLPLWPNTSCFKDGNFSRLDPNVPCVGLKQTVEAHNVTLVSPTPGWNSSLSIAHPWSFASGVGDLSMAGVGGTGPWAAALDASWPFFKAALGGVVVYFAPPPNGPALGDRFQQEAFTLNYRSRVYLFRYSPSPAMFDATEPTWLSTPGGSWKLLDATGPQGLSARILNISAPPIPWANLTSNSAGVPCSTTSPSLPNTPSVCALTPDPSLFDVTACSATASSGCSLGSPRGGPCAGCASPGTPVLTPPSEGTALNLWYFWGSAWGNCSEPCGPLGVTNRSVTCWVGCSASTTSTTCTSTTQVSGSTPTLFLKNKYALWSLVDPTPCKTSCSGAFSDATTALSPAINPFSAPCPSPGQETTAHYRAYAYTGDGGDNNNIAVALRAIPSIMASGGSVTSNLLSSSSLPRATRDQSVPTGLMPSGTTFRVYGVVDGWEVSSVPSYLNGTNTRQYFLAVVLDPDVTPTPPIPVPSNDLMFLLATMVLFLAPQLLILSCQYPLLEAIAWRPDLLQSYVLSRTLPESNVAARERAAREAAKVVAEKERAHTMQRTMTSGSVGEGGGDATPRPSSSPTVVGASPPASPRKGGGGGNIPSLSSRVDSMGDGASSVGDGDEGGKGKEEKEKEKEEEEDHALEEHPLEHIIACALLSHPETLRQQNSRRRALLRDVNAFYLSVAQYDAVFYDKPLKSHPSFANTVVCPDIIPLAPTPSPLLLKGGRSNGTLPTLTSFLRSFHWVTVLLSTLLATPPLLNLAHAITLLMQPPQSVPITWGLTVLLLGNAGYALLWGMGAFVSGKYRPTYQVWACFGGAFALLLVWAYACLFLDRTGEATNGLPTGGAGGGYGYGTLPLPGLASLTAGVTFIPLAFLLVMHHEDFAQALDDLGDMLVGLSVEDNLAGAKAARKAEELAARGLRGYLGTEYEREAAAAEVLGEKQKAMMGGIGGVVDMAGVLGIPSGREASIGNAMGTATLAVVEEACMKRDESTAAAAGGVERKGDGGRGVDMTSGGEGLVTRYFPPPPPVEEKKGGFWMRKKFPNKKDKGASGVQPSTEASPASPPPMPSSAKSPIPSPTPTPQLPPSRIRVQEQVLAGTSLGLSEAQDCALRLAAVSSFPWLHPPTHNPSLSAAFPARGFSSRIGKLLGPRLFSLLSAPPLGEMWGVDGISGLLSPPKASLPRIQRTCALVMGATLLLHLIIVLADPTVQMYASEHLAFVVTLAVLDYTAFCLVMGRLVNRPAEYFVALALVSRCLLVAYVAGNPGQWMAGISLAYAVWALPLAYEATVFVVPAMSQRTIDVTCYLAQFDQCQEYCGVVKRKSAAAARWQEEWVKGWGIQIDRPYGVHVKEKALDINQPPPIKLEELASGVAADAMGITHLVGDLGSADMKVAERREAETKAREAKLEAERQAQEDEFQSMVGMSSAALKRAAAKKKAEGLEMRRMAGEGTEELRQKALEEAMRAGMNPGKGGVMRAEKHPSRALYRVSDPVATQRIRAALNNVKGFSLDGHLGVTVMQRPRVGPLGSTMPSAKVEDGSSSSSATNPSSPKKGGVGREQSSARGASANQGSGSYFALDDAWPALRTLTYLFCALLFPHAAYMEVRAGNAAAVGFMAAGLWDSGEVLAVPRASFFGYGEQGGVKTWVIGVSVLVATAIWCTFLSAVTAFDLKRAGLLPHTNDLLIPRPANFSRPPRPIGHRYNLSLRLLFEVQYTRVHHTTFAAARAWATSFLGTVVVWYCAGAAYQPGSGTLALVLTGIFLPPLAALTLVTTRTYLSNDFSLAGPGKNRPALTRVELVRNNVYAGLPLSRLGRLEAWRRQLSPRERDMVKVLEFGPDGQDPCLFVRPCIKGEPDPTFFMEESRRDRVAKEQAESAVTAKMSAIMGAGTLTAQDKLVAEALLAAAKAKGLDISGRKIGEKPRRTMFYWLCCCCCCAMCPKIDYLALFGPCTRAYFYWRLRFVDMEEASIGTALLIGKLTPDDYLLFRRVVLLLVGWAVLGLAMANTVYPLVPNPVYGHAVWLTVDVVLLSLPSAMTYTHTLSATADVVFPLGLAAAMSGVSLWVFISAPYYTPDPEDARASIVAGTVVAYWGALCAYMSLRVWARRGFRHTLLTKGLLAFSTLAVFILGGILCAYADTITTGVVALCGMALALVAWVWMEVFSAHKGHLPPFVRRVSQEALGVSLVLVPALSAALRWYYSTAYSGGEPGEAFNVMGTVVFTVCYVCGACAVHWGGRAVVSVLIVRKDSRLVFGPFLLPAFSYDPETGVPISQDHIVLDAGRALGACAALGVLLTAFHRPLWVGLATLMLTLALGLTLVLATATDTTLALGEFSRFLDIEAVRGTRNVVYDAFFSRRRSVPVLRLIDSSLGATPLDAYANSGFMDSSDTLKRKGELLAHIAKGKDPSGNPTRAAQVAQRKIKEMGNLERERLMEVVEKRLAFIEPSTRVSNWHQRVSRSDAATHLSRAAAAAWCMGSCWPWQVGDDMASEETVESLLERLRVSDEKSVGVVTSLAASLSKGSLGAEEVAWLVTRGSHRAFKPHITAARAALAKVGDLGDAILLAKAINASDLVIPPPKLATRLYLSDLDIVTGPGAYPLPKAHRPGYAIVHQGTWAVGGDGSLSAGGGGEHSDASLGGVGVWGVKSTPQLLPPSSTKEGGGGVYLLPPPVQWEPW